MVFFLGGFCDKDSGNLVGMRLASLFALTSRDEDGVDVGNNTAVGDGDIGQEFVELLIVADGQHDMARDDADTLVIAGSVASKLENFGGQIFKYGSKIDGGTNTNTLGELTLLELAVESTDREGQTSAGRARGGGSLGSLGRFLGTLGGGLFDIFSGSRFTSTRHCG